MAVDAISVAPCGGERGSENRVGVERVIESMAQISHTSHSDSPESFPQCDFEDKDHPFCDWVQVLQDGGHWAQGSKNTLIHGIGPFGISLSGGEEMEDPSRQ